MSNYKVITLMVAVAGVIVALYGTMQKPADAPVRTGDHTVTSGNGAQSVYIGSGGNNSTININTQKAAPPSVREFNGQIQPVSIRGARDEVGVAGGAKFAEFLFQSEGKAICIDVWPYFTEEDEDRKDFELFKRPEIISIPSDPYGPMMGGVEVLIKKVKDEDVFYDGRRMSRRIFGCFIVSGITGPQQGWMSVVLKPIRREDALMLSK